MRNIRENLFFAFVYNAVGVPLAAGVLFPGFGLLLNPMIRRRCHELQFRLGDRQCPETADDEAMNNLWR